MASAINKGLRRVEFDLFAGFAHKKGLSRASSRLGTLAASMLPNIASGRHSPYD
jgi:hypothetical protein